MRLVLVPAVAALLASALAGCLAPGATEPVDPAGARRSVFSDTAVFPGAYDTTGPYARPLVEGVFRILDPVVEFLESDLDGATIPVGIVRPDVPPGTRVPVVAVASPYFRALTPEGIRGGAAQSLGVDLYDYYAARFVPHGYAFAFIPVRGTANAGGCSDFLGPAERADLDQAVTWLGTQDWSTGNVGMVGLSYDGSTPWLVASGGNPHLRTIVSVASWNDLYGTFYRNGSLHVNGLAYANALYYLRGFALNQPANGRSTEDTVAGALCPEAWEGLRASLHSSAFVERDRGGFWAERNARPGVEERYRGSVLYVHGFDDWRVPPSSAYPWVTELEAEGVVVKQLLGQWVHGYPDSFYSVAPQNVERWDWAEIFLHWLGYWLKGIEVDLGPPVQVQDSSGRWRNEAAWPPQGGKPVPFYLAPGGKLAMSPSTGTDNEVVGPDANAAETVPFYVAGTRLPAPLPCPACPRFQTDPFPEEFRFAGLPTVHLTVTPSGPGGHVAAFLYLVGADGAEARVGRGQIDLRVADGGETPEAVVPGQPLVARLQLEPLDVVVPAGSRLALVLAQGAMEERLPSMPTYPVQVDVGGDASVLTLHAFERGPEAFFEPPGAAVR